MNRKQRDKLRRRQNRDQRHKAKLRATAERDKNAPPRLPSRGFQGFVLTARGGTRIELAFPGNPIPFDVERPAESAAENHATVKAWEADGHPTEGSA